MKKTLTFLVLVVLLGTLRAEETATETDNTLKYRAEILRTTPGSILNDRGFSIGTEKLNKGESYPVVEQTLADVILLVRNSNVRVAKSDVLITEDAGNSGGGNYVRIVSAKYGFSDGNKWEVKEEIKKRMPSNPLTKPVKILVSDELLRAKAGTMVQTTVVNGRTVIMPRNDAVLTITYEVDGERKVKEVMEGKTLTLP